MSTIVVTPIPAQTSGSGIYFIDHIFKGEPGDENKIVPDVDSLIVDYKSSDIFYRVTHVDTNTGISTLRPAREGTVGGLSSQHALVGSGPGHISESFTLSIDTSKTPFSLDFDGRVRSYSDTATYCKIFTGDSPTTERVVSRVFDQQNNFQSENIPLQRMGVDDGSPAKAIFRPVSASISEAFPDGHVLKVVYYSAVGGKLHSELMLVENTDYIRRGATATRNIVGVSLRSPFISVTNDNIIEAPVNVPTEHIVLSGVVTYDDGTTKVLPIDGNRLRILGMDDYVSTEVGNNHTIRLSYLLASDENFVGGGASDNRTITEAYTLKTTPVDDAYMVKIFTYPVWIDDLNGYRLEHFFYTLNRGAVWRVSDKVRIATTGQTFKPLAYGTQQTLTFALTLDQVDPQFNAFTHVQKTDITLVAPGTDGDPRWTIGHDDTKPSYTAAEAKCHYVDGVNWSILVGGGFASQQQWLDELYHKVLPITDPRSESTPIAPTHFRIISGPTTTNIMGIANYNSTLLTVPTKANTGDTVFIQFVAVQGADVLELATVGLAVTYTQNP